MSKKLLWSLLPLLLIMAFLSCKKEKSSLEKNPVAFNLLDSKDKTDGLRTAYNRSEAESGEVFNNVDATANYPDSMLHIAEGTNKTAYVPWSFFHAPNGEDKTKYFPTHIAEGEHKTQFNPVWVSHVPYGPDKTKAHNFHTPDGPNKTYYIPNAPGYEHIASGDNATFFRPVPNPGTWVHIIDGPQKTLYVQIKSSSTGLRALPAGYQHISQGDNKSYYGRK